MEASVKTLVSVAIPLYNHARFIGQCLNSVVQDPYPDKEILVIDDGSVDGSAYEVERWRNNEGRTFSGRFEFLSRENRGLTRTLNELVSMARGDFICLVASDDYLLPGGIAARVNYLMDNPDKMAVFADCIVVDAEGNLLYNSGLSQLYRGRKNYLAHEVLRSYELIFRWCVPGPVFLARREVYQKIGGYDEALIVEDWDFYLRLLSRDLLGFVDVCVAAYRLHGDNAIYNEALKHRFGTSMFVTLSKNLKSFSGLKRFRLGAIRVSMRGAMYSRSGQPVMGLIMRVLGRGLRLVTDLVYGLIGWWFHLRGEI